MQGLLEAILEDGCHTMRNACLRKNSINTNTFLRENDHLKSSENLFKLQFHLASEPETLWQEWPNSTFLSASCPPVREEGWGFIDSSKVIAWEKAGTPPLSFLSICWNVYHHMLERYHQDKRQFLINKSKLRNNWNPLKLSSNIKTKGEIC